MRQARRPREQQNPLGLCLERSVPAVLGLENQREEQTLTASALDGTSGFAWINPPGFGSILRHPPPLGCCWAGTAFIPAPLVVEFSSLSHVAGLAFSFLLPSHAGDVLSPFPGMKLLQSPEKDVMLLPEAWQR